ncbi:uncharacterized protein TNIN_277731 [Trichonephila inaurata madagascariensis]|uniref:Uncharacterized protein n=1 Tax=Trichonephila inaurata madagascariensis TaxID=2747483 RepID=A0A8X6XU24_9ARAC|nr:uncharacterized protein TNIN_277731 [Trichonephila inaurata madagascariensis]
MEEVMEIVRLFDRKVSSDLKTKSQGCEHKYVIQNDDDGWYICQACGEELWYNPNKSPIDLYQLYLEAAIQRRSRNRMNNLTKWLGTYNLPYEEELLNQFYSFVLKYEELFPERKNLISKENILFHLLWKRDYQVPLKLPKLKKMLARLS